jgi:hypothetical protein
MHEHGIGTRMSISDKWGLLKKTSKMKKKHLFRSRTLDKMVLKTATEARDIG